LPASIETATPQAIAEAARLLRAGKLVAFPTETVYGLGGDATDGSAVAGIFAAKGRPRFNPLIVHVADFGAAEAIAEFGRRGRDAAARFWPGPLTLVLRQRPDCSARSGDRWRLRRRTAPDGSARPRPSTSRPISESARR
jgi:L-threonylcarbamoyladenylate synthase